MLAQAFKFKQFHTVFNVAPQLVSRKMAPKRKGGIRNRLGINKPAEIPPAEIPMQPARRAKGGIRARMNVAKSKPKKSIAREQNAKGPLVNTLKRKWGTGKISAKDVAEIFNGARTQGASGVPALSSLDHPQHLHRSLTA